MIREIPFGLDGWNEAFAYVQYVTKIYVLAHILYISYT